MANKIFLNPQGYVEVTVEGPQTFMSFENLLPDAQDFLEQLQKEGKKRLGLVDLTNQTEFSVDSNRAGMQILESLNYEKLAFFGAKTIITEVAKAIILAIGKNDNTRIFSDRESAVKWLLS
jgi:ribonucleotide monophosphatase NagD (HAD superfamily)